MASTAQAMMTAVSSLNMKLRSVSTSDSDRNIAFTARRLFCPRSFPACCFILVFFFAFCFICDPFCLALLPVYTSSLNYSGRSARVQVREKKITKRGRRGFCRLQPGLFILKHRSLRVKAKTLSGHIKSLNSAFMA